MREDIKQVKTEHQDSGKVIAARVMDVIFSIIEILLAFRLVFKLFGANPNNGFVDIMYKITYPFMFLFKGIFKEVSFGGEGATKIFEPATLIAVIVIAILAWVIHKLVYPNMKKEHEHTQVVRTEHNLKDDETIDT